MKSVTWLVVVVALIVMAISGCENKSTSESSEGSIASPVTLTVNSAHQGTIAEFGTSYYKFVAIGDNASPHTIALTQTQSDLSWDLYSNSDYFTGWLAGKDDILAAGDEIGTIVLVNGTTYYLLVDEWDLVDGTYSLLVSF